MAEEIDSAVWKWRKKGMLFGEREDEFSEEEFLQFLKT